MLKAKHLVFLHVYFFYFYFLEPVRRTTKLSKTLQIPVSTAIPSLAVGPACCTQWVDAVSAQLVSHFAVR